jgi:hypothetical protein
MRKALFPISIVALFAATLFVNVSFDSKGHLSLLNKANALPPPGWESQIVDCYVAGIYIGSVTGCFSGQDPTCSPGNCDDLPIE